MNKHVNRTVGLALLIVFTAQAVAQDAGTLLREQELQQQRQTLPTAPVEQDLIPDVAPAVEDRSETVLITALQFTGETDLLPPQDRQALADSVVGQRLGIRGLRAFAERVTAQLQQQGHVLAFALLPPQDVTEGKVTLHIQQGQLEKIIIEPDESVRMRTEVLRAIAEKPLERAVAREHLEEALLRLNDLPDITARGSLAPGQAPNSSRLYVRVNEGPLLGAAIQSNNYGVATTGEFQTVASLSLSDASGYGDFSTLALSHSQGHNYAALGSSLPLGASGFAARARVSRLDYEHREDPGKLLELEGYAQQASVGMDYGLIRSRALNLTLIADYEWKTLVDDSILGKLQNKKIDSIRVGVSGDYRDGWLGGGVTSANLGMTFGRVDLSALPDALAADQASLQTDGRFARLNLGINRFQALPGNLSLLTSLYGQWASTNLDSSEELNLGGPYGLRGWPVSEAQGDSGLLGTVELRYHVHRLPAIWGQLQLAAFLDAGRIRVNQDDKNLPLGNACNCNSYSLESIGLGANWLHEHWQVNTIWARGLGNNPGRNAVTGDNADGGKDKQQFWVQVSFQF